MFMLITRKNLEQVAVIFSDISDGTLEYSSAVLVDWFRQTLLGDVRRVCSDRISGIKANRIFLLINKTDALGLRFPKIISKLKNDHPEGYAIVSFRQRGKDIIALIGNASVGVLWAVRDLIHFYADVKGKLKYDPNKGNCYSSVAKSRKIIIPDLDVSSAPAIRWRTLWAYDLDRNIVQPIGQKYFAENPYLWIEQMSRWKLNAMILYEGPHGQLIDVEPELFRYAKRRGVELIPSMSFYSYATEAVAPSWCKRSPKRHKIPKGQLWATNSVMCPSDADTRKWMIEYVLDFIGRHQLRSLYFQIGDIDYAGCRCSACRRYSRADYFLFVTQPILKEIYRVFPDIRIIAGVLNWPEYFQTISKLDKRVEFLFEGGTFPSANSWGHERKSNPADVAAASNVREGKSGFVYRFYMGGMCAAWLDDRYWALGQLRDWLTEQKSVNAPIATGLMQRKPRAIEPFLQAFFAQLCWKPDVYGKSFDNLILRVKRFAPLEQIYAGLISDSEEIIMKKQGRISYRKKLVGLQKFGQEEQFHGIRGEYIGDVLQSEMQGDIIHYETEFAEYTFKLKENLVKPKLVLTGCVDDNNRGGEYPLEIKIKGYKSIKVTDISLPKGKSVSVKGFINPGKFCVFLPYTLKKGVIKIRIKFLSKYGWIWLKEIYLSGR